MSTTILSAITSGPANFRRSIYDRKTVSLIIILTLFPTLFVASKAQANDLSFTASGFTSSASSSLPPSDPVSGDISFTLSPSPDLPGDIVISSVDSVDLTIADHTYSLSDISFRGLIDPSGGFSISFGGPNSGVNGFSGTDINFDITVSLAGAHMTYADGGNNIWYTSNINYTLSPSFAVPEPATTYLVFAGLTVLGLSARRRAAQGSADKLAA